ncbi:MAG: glycosyltransferase family 39 protein, partial [Bacillota bacterium]|nr:glycosyltransferase family 39 protein [Bacillota bacterium]
YLITNKLFNKKIALVASLLTAICPFLVFYDRLAVADSLLTSFGVWSFYLGLKLIEKPDLGKSFLLGLCWAGGLLTKQPGLYFIFLFPTLIFFSKKRNFKFLIYAFLSLLIALVGYNVIKLSPYSHLISVRSYDYILGKREFLNSPFKLFLGNLKSIIPWISSYQTFFGTLFFVLGAGLLLKNNLKKAIVFLIWLMIPILGSAAIGKIIFPRYFLFIEPWIIVFIAYGIVFLLNLIKTKTKTLFTIHYSLFTILLLPWLIFSFFIVFNPTKAPLIKREQDQYLTTWSSGYGIKEAAQYLKSNYPYERVDIGTEGYFGTLPDGLQVYLDGYKNINIFGVGQPLDKTPDILLERAKLNPTFLVINDSRYFGSDINLVLIKKYPKPEFPFLKESLLFFKVKSE